MDAITRDIIVKLTTRVADLEAAVEVNRTMLKEMAQTQAMTTGKTFDPLVFDLQHSEAVAQQREKMTLPVEAATTEPVAPFVLTLPEVGEPEES